MIRAAGLLFLTPDNQVLFLKRSASGDCAGMWCLPGGKIEEGESAEEAAVREAVEEIGLCPDGMRSELTRRIGSVERVLAVDQTDNVLTPLEPADPEIGSANPVAVVAAATAPAEGVALPPPNSAGAPTVDFTTFLQRVPAPFAVTLSEESSGWAWAPLSSPPQPLHPGCNIATQRLGMDELGVARAMAAGELTSPQRYENVTLFAIRITGTGAAYRTNNDEFVWRDPSLYMNDEFLARCNGLPVIYEHPKNATLNSKEFADRIIGTTFLPYLRTDLNEVWGIVKIYDDEAIQVMSSKEIRSTSPAVVLRDVDSTKLQTEDGRTLLIEGKPKLLDHICICPLGVWDCGGEPRGITATGSEEVSRIDSIHAPDYTKVNCRLDSVNSRLNSSRLDSAYRALMRRI
jgi:8-oxo-dGTP pyrophosphatase MutT (NUDIX family)